MLQIYVMISLRKYFTLKTNLTGHSLINFSSVKVKSIRPIYLVWFGLVSLFNGISTLFRLFNAKAILLEEQ